MEKEQANLPKKEGRVSVFGAVVFFFSLCFGIFVFLGSVLSFCSFFYPINKPLFSRTIQINKPEQILLTGSDGVYFANLPMQQIQLTESLNPLRTLEIRIALVLKKQSDFKIIASRLPVLQDTLISDLKNITLSELAQNERLFIIKETLLDHFNTLLEPVQIQDVLLQKIVVKENE